MKLAGLNPKFWSTGGEGIYQKDKDGDLIPTVERKGMGILFDCPCDDEKCSLLYLPFENPIDGGKQISYQDGWKRTGEDFETMSLTPSIRRMDNCKWHGYLTNGELIACADSGN